MEDYKKKYEQAFERARKINSGEGVAAPSDYTICETIFPELKESEDESIRKEIIEFICWAVNRGSITEKQREKSNLWIAWLKKQGEQKFPSLSEKEIVCLKRILDFLREEHNSYTGKDFTNEIVVLEWLITHPVLINSSELQQNQGEQKPVDKVEPKFKVGDWIINSEGMLRHILAVDKTGYQTDYGWLTHDIYDNTYHLWTIQDAKDGDILVTSNGGICIFDNTVEEGIYPFAYCGLTRHHGFEVYDRKLPFTHDKDIRPATKEQREILFQKMKEAGYEWDAENKELKKIEQTYFQKQEWTGYDEKAYEIALLDIDKSPSITKNDTIDWLKSLKNRVQLQPKQEWSEEDEKIIKNLSSIIVANSKNNYLGHYYTPDLITKLQSLRHSRKLLNQEWSEEDENMLQKALSTIRYALSIPADKEDEPCFAGSSTIAWLKSLKERYTWKPSNEQIKGIECAIKTLQHQLNVGDKRLDSLYNDLKKLREE